MSLLTHSTVIVLKNPITAKVVLVPEAAALNLCTALLEPMALELAKPQPV